MFQLFLLEEFNRAFNMFCELERKESATNDRLICALEKCDELESEVEKLRNQLSEYNDYDL
jgi:hypothetical protein